MHGGVSAKLRMSTFANIVPTLLRAEIARFRLFSFQQAAGKQAMMDNEALERALFKRMTGNRFHQAEIDSLAE